MRLKRVSRFFDKTVCRDAYGQGTFKAQLEPFDVYKLDGAAVKRRMMSAAADVVIPRRRTIDISGQKYLVGDGTPDHWNNEVIRMRYVLHGADYLATVRTIAETLADSGGFTAWVSRDWNRDTTDTRVSAENISQYHIFFGSYENVPDEAVVELSDGRFYLVQGVHRALSGFVDALSNEIPEPVFETIQLNSRTYDPVGDSYTESATSVRVLRLRWQEAFQYLTRASVEYERGDLLVMMLRSGTPSPRPGDVLSLSDGDWKIVSHIEHVEHYSLHLRRV